MNKIKKIIALVLAAVMIMAVSPLAFAGNISVNQDCPYIYIHGFASETIYDDPTNPNAKPIFSPPTEEIIQAVSDSLPVLAEYVLTDDGDKLADDLVSIFYKLFSPCYSDKDGNIPNKSGVKFSYPPKQYINKYSQLEFNYDWRLDPIETAAQLNDYINYVCDASGCDKVAIMAHSFGGVVTLTYASIYGMEKLKGVVLNSTAIYGQIYAGELMTGDLKLDMDAVRAFLQYVLSDTEYNALVDGVMELFEKAGLSNFLEKYGNKIIADAGDKVMREVIFPMLFHWPSVWAMVPDVYLEDAYKYVFDGNLIDKETDYTVLRGKINAYNTLVREGKTEKLISMEENMKLGVYARYGFSTIPITSSWQIMSDGIIDTKSASFGATTAKYGETLSSEYLAGVDKKFVSPDNSVDASTCLFPEKTWFIKNKPHNDSQILNELTMAILYSDNEVTVDTYEDYPRFIIYSEGELYPQKKDDTPNPFQKLAKFLKQLFSFLKLAYNKIFKK